MRPWLCVVTLLAVLRASAAAVPQVPYDEATATSVVQEVGTPGAPARGWILSHGELLEASLDGVVEKGRAALRLSFETRPDKGTWIAMTYQFDPPQDWSQATEVQVVVRAAAPKLHWFQVTVTEAGGAVYQKAFDAQHFSTQWETKSERFASFALSKNSKDDNGKLDLNQISAIRLILGPAAGIANKLTFQAVRVVRAARQPKALLLVSDHPRHNVFRHGESVGVTAYVRRLAGAHTLRLAVLDYFGRRVATKELEAREGGEYRIELPHAPGKHQARRAGQPAEQPAGAAAASATGLCGHFTVRGELLNADKTVAHDQLFLAVLPPEPAGFRELRPDSPFGMLGTANTLAKSGWHPSHEFYPELGLKWTGYYMDWSKWEPERGRWNLPDPAKVRDSFRKRGVQFHCSVFQAPRWATGAPAEDRRWMRYPPRKWEDWEAFCRQAARLFPRMALPGPRVYELWPEPIYPWGWKGTTEQLAELYRRSARIIHETDPGAQVFGYIETGSRLRLTRDLFALGAYEALDGFTTHAYQDGAPEACGFVAELREFRLLMRERGREKPLWLTEQGWTTGPGNMVDVHTHAAWWARKVVQALSEGVQKYIGFYLVDYGSKGRPHADTYGLMYNLDPKVRFGPAWAAPKPAFCAYATLTRVLFKSRYVGELPRPRPTIRAYVFRRGEEPVVVAWDTAGANSYDLPAAVPVPVVDIMGNSIMARPTAGRIRIQLATSPVYVNTTILGTTPAPGLSRDLLRQAKPLPDALALAGLRKMSGAVRLLVEPGRVQLRAGGRAKLKVSVTNQRNTWFAAELRVAVPDGWPQLASQPFKINNLETVTREVELHCSPQAAGSHRVRVAVWSAGAKLAEVGVQVEVK